MGFELRRAVPEDAEAIGRVHAQSWRETYGPLMSAEWLAAVSDEERIEMWRGWLTADRQPPWVAVVDDAIVGFANSGTPRDENPPRALELWAIYVLASHQGRGIGRALAEASIGQEPASVHVLRDNAQAIGFYRSLGFEPDGYANTLEYWEDVAEIRMVR